MMIAPELHQLWSVFTLFATMPIWNYGHPRQLPDSIVSPYRINSGLAFASIYD